MMSQTVDPDERGQFSLVPSMSGSCRACSEGLWKGGGGGGSLVREACFSSSNDFSLFYLIALLLPLLKQLFLLLCRCHVLLRDHSGYFL